MKKLTKDELQKDADRLMKSHGKQAVSATQDGQYFFAKQDAVNYNAELARTNKEWDGEVFDFAVANEAKETEAAKQPEPVKEPLKEPETEKEPAPEKKAEELKQSEEVKPPVKNDDKNKAKGGK